MARWLEDLIRHKAHADAALLSAIRENDAAARDEELLNKVHHILLANRFWLSLALGREFSLEAESRRPETIDQIDDLWTRLTDELIGQPQPSARAAQGSGLPPSP